MCNLQAIQVIAAPLMSGCYATTWQHTIYHLWHTQSGCQSYKHSESALRLHAYHTTTSPL